MAIRLKIKEPKNLIKAIEAKIDDGSIRTWVYDEDGDYTHNTEQWINRAWFHPCIFQNDKYIIFSIIGRNDVNLTMTEFSIYHGRFIEMLVSHFYDVYDELEILPKGNMFDPLEIDKDYI